MSEDNIVRGGIARSEGLPFVSVVIPAYNEENYLPACLESIKNQDYAGKY